jgi:hemerythrin superfamily protein
MDAIELLKAQHREVEDLFSRIEKARTSAPKRKLFEQTADRLAVHAAIEEHQFYPAVKAKRTEDILLESLEEHLGIKRVIADLLKIDGADDTFEAKVTVLKELVQHHVKEEESELFPKAKKVLSPDELVKLGQTMTAEAQKLESEGSPRDAVSDETDQAASLL